MARSPSTLSALRQLVRERFPQSSRIAGTALPTGVAGVDERSGGLPRGALTELVCEGPSCGGQLFFGRMLAGARERGGRVGLVDAADRFDPQSWPEEALEALTWVRCRNAEEAVAAADIFARDANVEIVAVDLRDAPPAALRRVPGPSWYRLQRAAEQSDGAILLVTPFALVPSAQLRLALRSPHRLASLEEDRSALAGALEVLLQRQRMAAAG